MLLPMWIFFLLGTIFGAWALHSFAHGRSTMHHGPTFKHLTMLESLPHVQGAFAERLLDKDALFIPAFATTFLGVVYMTLRLHVIHSALSV